MLTNIYLHLDPTLYLTLLWPLVYTNEGIVLQHVLTCANCSIANISTTAALTYGSFLRMGGQGSCLEVMKTIWPKTSDETARFPRYLERLSPLCHVLPPTLAR